MASGVDLGIDQLTDAEIIGRGGFSTVYAATDTQFDRRVAVKVLRELSKASDRDRFERECKVMGRLSSHPNVVTLYHAGYTADDEPYMIMELNDDGSLADLLEAEGTVRWQRALQLMIPTVRALHHAHEAGVLHRDVKPENILLADGVPRLTDFGIAYLRDSTGATSTGITASWLHTAPETFDNQRDERSDVYSATSTLYNLIAGRAPFENPDDESLNPLMRRLLDEAPPPLPAGAAPAALSAYVARGLAKAPAERPVTAAAMADGLQLILDSGGLKMPVEADGSVQADPAPPATPDPGPGRPIGPRADLGAHPSGAVPAGSTRPISHQAGPVGSPGNHIGRNGGGPASPNLAAPSGPPDPSRRLGGPPIPNPAHHPNAGRVQVSAHVEAGAREERAGGLGRTMLLVFAAAATFVVVAAAGGIAFLASGDGSVESAETPAAPPPPLNESPVSTDAVPPDDSTFDPSDRPDVVLPAFDGPAGTIGELDDRWAQNRAAVVTALSANGYGIDDSNMLHGPGGFSVDLNDCPAGWSETGGIDDGRIQIGQTIAQTGQFATYANLSTGMTAYFDVINASGGIDGRSIELLVRDDAYDIAQAIDEVDSLVNTEQVFAVTTLGTGQTLSTYDQVNASCVPHPFVATSHPGFGDPVNHPFTTGLPMSWGVEAVLWGNWIEANMADQLPVRVAAIVTDNDFGLAYASPFAAWADAHPDVVAEFVQVPHEPGAVDLNPEMTVVAAADADVFISMTAGDACTQAAQEVDDVALGAEVRFQSSVCRDPSILAAAGQAADGFLTMGGGTKASDDPQFANDPFVEFVNAELEAAGLETTVNLYGSGFGFYGWTWVETLRIAAELPGGLTRSNFLLAARGMQLMHPMLIDGIPFGMTGNDDAFYIQSSDVHTFDTATGQWTAGTITSAEGETPTCRWTSSGCLP